ncbi:hypothetical protein GQ457_14G026780 [Hibiscus cannabinus]
MAKPQGPTQRPLDKEDLDHHKIDRPRKGGNPGVRDTQENNIRKLTCATRKRTWAPSKATNHATGNDNGPGEHRPYNKGSNEHSNEPSEQRYWHTTPCTLSHHTDTNIDRARQSGRPNQESTRQPRIGAGGYRYSTKEGIDTRPWVSIPGMGIDTQKPYWNSGIGFAHNRVSILKGGYRVSGYRYHKGGIDTKMPGRHI